MAISPPSDLVLDVVRAADPLLQQMAFDRLSRLSSPGAAGTQFAAAVEGAPGLPDAREKLAGLGSAKPSGASPEVASATNKTLRQFEAQVISTFLEQMMPESTGNTFGSGLSGGVWRSMLSEQIAGEIAKSGGLGIRDKVLAAMSAQAGVLPGSEPSNAVAAANKVLDSRITGANSRDGAIPLAVERHFIDITGSAAARKSSTRQG